MKSLSKSARIGVVMLVVTLLVAVGLFSKDRIDSMLLSGETIEVRFDKAYKLRPHVSQVKVAFVVVGKVTGVEKTGDDAVVRVKVDRDVLDSLGSEPTATIRPTTLLGGAYFVDLQPGGDPGAFTARSIPVERTSLPVELDRVARTLQPEARRGVQRTVRRLDATLDKEGRRALRDLVASAPGALDPAADVADAAQGLHPKEDLGQVVTGLENLGRTLSRTEGQLDGILADAAVTARTLDRRSTEVASAVQTLPGALDATREGLADLDGSLSTLREVAADSRPLARQLDRTLGVARPVVQDARPLVSDLRTVLRDARPVVDSLVPTVTSADQAVSDLRGNVLDRLDGEVTPWLHAKPRGKAPYQYTTSEKPMYQEVAYLFANLTRASGHIDANGHTVSLLAGVGTAGLGGLPVSIEQMFKILTQGIQLKQPLATLPQLGGGR